MRNFIISVMLAVFAFSCGDSVATKSKPKNDNDASVSDNDSDQTVSDDENVADDNQTVKDDEAVKDDISVPDEDSVISDTCGNTSIEWPEVCDGGTMDCVDIDDTKYSSGKAKCKDNCSGWDTATCVEIEPENCMNGDRRCYGAYQYQICAGGVWGEPATCSKSGTCYGEGLCSNDCYPSSHYSYSCESGHVYWYDSCGDIEEIKENCGTSGYTGSKYCIDNDVYQDYKTVTCDYQSCGSNTEGIYIEYCANGCVAGVCNGVGAEESWYDSTSGLTWQNSNFSANISATEGATYCSNLVFDSYSDWRLPTISELRSLVRGCSSTVYGGACQVTDSCTSYDSCRTSCSSCTSGYGSGSSGKYWDSNLTHTGTTFVSSTILSDYTTYSWSINFLTAAMTYDYSSYSKSIICVRGTMSSASLTPPTGVTASDGSYDDYVYITWTAVSGATDYYIYRATSSTGTYSKIDSSGGYNYYYDYPPSINTSYYYKVAAYNSTYGESAMSSYNAGWCY